MELLNPTGEKLKTVTDVTPHEIFSLPLLFSMGKIFKSTVMEDYGTDFLKLRISRVRSSRQEFIFLGSGLANIGQDRKARGLGDLFQGLKG